MAAAAVFEEAVGDEEDSPGAAVEVGIIKSSMFMGSEAGK